MSASINFHRPIAFFLIGVTLHMAIGCNYYYITKPKGPVPDELKIVVGDPQTGIPEMKRGTAVQIVLKDGQIISKYFLMTDGEFIHVGSSRKIADQKISVAEVQTIRKTSLDKYFIVHHKFEPFHLSNPYLDNNSSMLIGAVEEIPREHLQYLQKSPKPGRSTAYKTGYNPGNEVHVYADEATIKDGIAHIPVKAIQKLDIYKDDPSSAVGSVLLGTLGVILVVGIIAAATKRSCPFIYVKDGNRSDFVGEIYPGAIAPGLERTDFLPLPSLRLDTVEITVANELLEREYTNQISLRVASVPDGKKALADQDGIFYPISNAIQPSAALADDGNDYLSSIRERDSLNFAFNVSSLERKETSMLTMAFKNEESAPHARLILKLRNDPWLDLVYGKFMEQFGTSYPQFVAYRNKQSGETLNNWIKNEHIPITIQLLTHTGWKEVSKLRMVGPLAFREMAVPIDLKDAAGKEIQIRMETGFNFWNLDYAAIDYTQGEALPGFNIQPLQAIDQNGADVLSLIKRDDNQYLEQPLVGDKTTVKFVLPSDLSGNRILLLEAKGYYEHIRNYTHSPDYARMISFCLQGSFAKFAKEQRDILGENQELIDDSAVTFE